MTDRLLHRQTIALILGLAIGPGSALSQKVAGQKKDLSWVREFANPSRGSGERRENLLNFDRRFRGLLVSSLPQQQRFWRDHGRFPSLPDLAQAFLGVPHDVLIDENRYVTADGCVPHDGNDRGMVWIDTDSAVTPSIVFVATGWVSNAPGESGSSYHFWLFSSKRFNVQSLPPPFLASLSRWKKSNEANGYHEHIVLVTLVQSDGQMEDVSPSLFSFGRSDAAKE